MGFKKGLLRMAGAAAKHLLGEGAVQAASALKDLGIPERAVDYVLDATLDAIPKTDKYLKKGVNKAIDMYGEFRSSGELMEEDYPDANIVPGSGLVRQPTFPTRAVREGYSSIGAPFNKIVRKKMGVVSEISGYDANVGIPAADYTQAIELHKQAKNYSSELPERDPATQKQKVIRARKKKAPSDKKVAKAMDQLATTRSAKEVGAPTQRKKPAPKLAAAMKDNDAEFPKDPKTARKMNKSKQKTKLSAAQSKHEKAERKLLKLIGEKASKEEQRKQKQKITLAKAAIKKAEKKLDYL